MRICAADLEGDGLLDEATTVWCGVFKEVNTNEKWRFGPDQVQEMLKFLDTVDVLIFHNGTGYDFPVLLKLYGYDYKGVRIDTLLMSRLQSPDRRLPFNCPNKKAGPHSIEAWGYRVGRGKPEHNDWSMFSDEMMHRCDEDVEILHLVFLALKEEGGPAWAAAHKLTQQVFEILHEQEQYGWLVDQPWIHESISMLDYWIDKLDRIILPSLPLVMEIEETKKSGEYNFIRKPFLKSGRHSEPVLKWLHRHGHTSDSRRVVSGPFARVNFRLVNLNSGDETKAWLLSDGWIPDKWNYKKVDGQFVKDDNGQRIKTSPVLNGDDPFVGVGGIGRLIARRVQCRHRKSQLEGWLKVIRPDGRISQGISGSAATGRLKHKRIVNVPGGDAFFGKWMRKCFIAKEGYRVIGVDSAGCQLRMLAARMGDAAYREVIVNGDKSKGTDMHSVNMRAAGLVSRAQAKTFIYGFLFGAGDAKIGLIVKGGAADGKRLKAQFLEGLPALGALIERLTAEWRSNAKTRKGRWGVEYYNGWFVGLDGRPIHCKSEHMVLVYALQSDEAILMQHALLLLKERLDALGWTHGVEYGFVANVHDEIQAEVREDCCPTYAKIAEQCITDAGVMLGIECPHEGEADIGFSWWDTH